MKLKFYFCQKFFISVSFCILCTFHQTEAQDTRTGFSPPDTLHGIPGLKSAFKRPILVSPLQAIPFQTKPYESNKQIVIQTGESISGSNPIVSLGPGSSINNSGKIAFTALESSKKSRKVLLYDHGVFVTNYYQPAWLPGTVVQVNDLDHIAYWAEYHIDPGLNTFVFRLDPGKEQNEIVRGNPWVKQDPNVLYLNISPFFSLANNDKVIFSGDLRAGHTVLATGISCSFDYKLSIPVSNFPEFFPMLSDNNRSIIRGGASETSSIVLFLDDQLNGSNGILLGSYPEFLSMGEKPGISDDGMVSVFMAEHSTEGVGLYVTTVNNSGQAAQFKLNDLPGSQVILNHRVAVNRSGSASKHEYNVVYITYDEQGGQALCSTIIDVSNPYTPVIKSTSVIAKAGDTIEGLNGKIKKVEIYDPVNNSNEIVFWVLTDSNNQAIIKANNFKVAFTYEDVGRIVNNKWEIRYSFKDGTETAPEQTIKEYLWEFGDGKTSTEKDPVHTYEKAGNYTVSLTVTNTAGETDKKTIENCISDLGFRPQLNGWIYPNKEYPVWHYNHYIQFDYKVLFGNDPTWNSIFGDSFPANSTFPDFQLFAETFGYGYCYINDIATRIALEKWVSVQDEKGEWKGSCFGFSISSLLFFNNYLKLSEEFPGNNNLYKVSDQEKACHLINKYFLYQWDNEHQAFVENAKNNSVNTTVLAIQKSFNTTNDYIPVSIWKIVNGEVKIAHSVVPYKIETNTSNINELKIFVYDSNNPGVIDKKITIDKKNGTWAYGVSTVQKNGFFNRPPISTYLKIPKLKSTIILPQFQIFASVTNDIIINKNNELLGYSTSKIYQKTSFGTTIEIDEPYNINPRPKGYYINSGEYNAILDNFETKNTRFSVFTDTLSFFYKRSDANVNQKDILLFGSNYLKVVNDDEKKKLFDFMCIFNQPSNEKVIEFNKVEINPKDTISFYFTNSTEVNMKTSKLASAYEFRANVLTETNADFYPEKDVHINANTTQVVTPYWEDILNKGVLLKVDDGSNGSIDKSSNLNTFTGTSVFKDLLLVVSVYPNPSQGKYKIECNENVSKAIITVCDIQGRQITSYQLDNQQRKWTSEIDLTQFSNGVYLLKIITDKKVFEKILIKN